MRRWTTPILGLVWGLLWLLVFGGSLESRLRSMPGSAVVSATLELIGADHVIPPLKLLLLPSALGLDLAIWTLGLFIWPFSGQRWPGAALGVAMSANPLLGSLVVVVFSGLGGIGLAYGARWVVRAFRRLPSQR